MADEKNQDTPEVELTAEQVVPAPLLQRLKNKEFKSAEQAQEAITEYYMGIAKNKGYAIEKDVQIGTHNSLKKEFRERLSEIGETIDLPETATTKEWIKATAEKIAAIKKLPAKDQPEDVKKYISDLEQTKKALEASAQKEKEYIQKLQEKDTEVSQKIEAVTKSFFVKDAMQKAFGQIKSSLLPSIESDVVETLFDKQYSIDVSVENGAVKGYTIREKDGSQAMKKPNEFFADLPDALRFIASKKGLVISQPAQKETAPKHNGSNPTDKKVGGLKSNIHVPKGV